MTIYDKLEINGSEIGNKFDLQVKKTIGQTNAASNFTATIDNFNGQSSNTFNVGDEVTIYADKQLIVPCTPLAHYKMNDDAASTVVIDSGTGGNNGTATFNTEDNSVTGKVNNALEFDGVDDYVQTNFGNPTEFTYMCWFKVLLSEQDFNNPSGGNVALMWTTDDNPGIQIISNGTIKGNIKDVVEATKAVTSTNTINDNEWNHIALTFDGSTLKLYLNNVLEDTESVTGRGVLSNNSRLMRDDAGRFVKGKQDDVRIYDKSLTAAQISTIYNDGNGTEKTCSDQKIFTGILETTRFPSRELNQNMILKGRDFTARLIDRTVEPEVYTNLPAGSIVKDIINKYTDDITVTNVEDSSTIVSRISFNHTPVFDAIKELSELAEFTFYVDNDKDLHFEEKSMISSGKTFNNTNTIRANFIEKRDTVFNEIWIYGDRYLDGFVESFTADGTGSVFTLTHKPHNTLITNDGTTQKGAIENMSVIPASGVDYLVNYDDSKIIFISGTDLGYSTIPISGNSIVVDYKRSLPIVKVGRDQTSINDYGKRIKSIIDKSIKDPATAQERLVAELTNSSLPKKEGSLNLNGFIDVLPSQTATVDFPDQNVNNMVYDILEVQYDFNKKNNLTENVLVVQVNKKLNDISDTIKDLINEVKLIQAQDITDSDIITRFEFTTGSIGIRQSGCIISSRSIAGDTLIWGNNTFGIWGTGKWGNQANTSFILGNPQAAVLGTSKLGTQTSNFEVIWSGCYPI